MHACIALHTSIPDVAIHNPLHISSHVSRTHRARQKGNQHDGLALKLELQ
jgi:hypothetical protein